mgnify:CR=1 FL=1
MVEEEKMKKSETFIPGANQISIGYVALFPGKLTQLRDDIPWVKTRVLNGNLPGTEKDSGITVVPCHLDHGKITLPEDIANHACIQRWERDGVTHQEGGPLQPVYALKSVERRGKDENGNGFVILPCLTDGSAPYGSFVPAQDGQKDYIVAYVNNIVDGITVMLMVEAIENGVYHAHISVANFTVNSMTGEVLRENAINRAFVVEGRPDTLPNFSSRVGEKYLEAFKAAMAIFKSMAKGERQCAMWVKDITRPITAPVPDAPSPVEEPASAPAPEAKSKGGKGKKAAKQPTADVTTNGGNGHTDTVPAPNEVVA